MSSNISCRKHTGIAKTNIQQIFTTAYWRCVYHCFTTSRIVIHLSVIILYREMYILKVRFAESVSSPLLFSTFHSPICPYLFFFLHPPSLLPSSLSHWFTLSLRDLWFPVFCRCKDSSEREAPARQPPYSIRQKFLPYSLCKQLVSIGGAVQQSCNLDSLLLDVILTQIGNHSPSSVLQIVLR